MKKIFSLFAFVLLAVAAKAERTYTLGISGRASADNRNRGRNTDL